MFFYLLGYANRKQRDFIKQVYKDNPKISFEHFGNIDAGGFWIHHNLCDITGIKFILFSMSVNELANPEYAEVVKYMLDNNLKLEQEIVSLKLMS